MTILDTIIRHKQTEVQQKRELYPVKLLERSVHFGSPCISLRKYLLRSDKSGIIAEIKRRSPSKGMIHAHVDVERTSIGYMQAGASALSVLTDQAFFGGSLQDLGIARSFNFCPILRKDFIVDEYQILESKSAGADAILLLANVLTRQQVLQYTQLAHSLGMEVLLEIHSADEVGYCHDEIDVTGINNRNLSTFEVSLQHSYELARQLPASAIRISESGIRTPEDLLMLRKAGFHGCLIGELFMQHTHPEKACLAFIEQVNKSASVKPV
jgi:indole-3-glycerol phosphate synthase